MTKIVVEYSDGLGDITIPELFKQLRRKVVASDNFVQSVPTTDYLQGDTIDEYSCENRGTRVSVFIFPNREELQMTSKYGSMWIVNDFIRYRLVLPLSKHFVE